jgi:energy-coupling factor transport system permease protein
MNPWLLIIIILATVLVTLSRKTDDPWASALAIGIKIALFALAIRMVIAIIFSVPGDGPVLFSLPRVQLPEWLAGIFLGGDVTSERLLYVFLESLTILALVVTIAGASSLANPKQTLRALPGVLHEAGVALIIATTLIPHFVTSIKRIREARKLRGDERRFSFKRSLVPLFEEALERALIMAESMESRGYGYRATTNKKSAPTALMFIGITGLLISVLQLLTNLDFQLTLILAIGALTSGLLWANNENSRSKYRPLPWRKEEYLVIISSALAVVIAQIAFNPFSALALFLCSSMPLFVTKKAVKFP